MADYISRQKAIEAIMDLPNCPNGYSGTYDKECIIGTLEEVPTADVAERKKGKWQVCSILDYAQRTTGRKVGKCPFCGFLTGEFRTLIECNAKLTNFCPNCGADMEADDADIH